MNNFLLQLIGMGQTAYVKDYVRKETLSADELNKKVQLSNSSWLWLDRSVSPYNPAPIDSTDDTQKWLIGGFVALIVLTIFRR